MSRLRKTITRAAGYWLAATCLAPLTVCAQSPVSEPHENQVAVLPAMDVIGPAPAGHPFRQIQPTWLDSHIRQVSFQQAVSSDRNSSDRNSDDRNSDDAPTAASDATGPVNLDAQPDLAARVRALEAEVERLSKADGSESTAALTTRVDQLEETFGEFEAEGSQFLETLSRTSRRIVNGRIHLDSWRYPKASPGINAIENGDFARDPENRMLVRRARIGIRGTVLPGNMSYRLELEFSGRDGARIRDAWLAWDDLPVLNTLRVGNQKRPYGFDHLNSSNFMTFLERPFVVDAVNRSNRRIGIASYSGTSDLAWNWQAGLFNMVQIQDTNDIVGDVAQTELAARLANTWWYDECSGGRGYGHWAAACTFAFPDGEGIDNQARFRTQPEAPTGTDWLDTGRIADAESYQLLAAEGLFNVGPLQLTAEWMNIHLQRPAGSGGNLFLSGGYVSVSYFLTGEHIPWNRKLGILGRVEPYESFFCIRTNDGERVSGMGAWQIALRLSRADFNSRDIYGGIGESATLALNWYWNAHTRMQFNYIFGRIDDRRVTLTNGSTPIVSGDYQAMGTRFMIDF